MFPTMRYLSIFLLLILSVGLCAQENNALSCADGIDNDRDGLIDCDDCLLYTSPSPRDKRQSRMPSSA